MGRLARCNRYRRRHDAFLSLRLEAAERFAAGDDNALIATDLRVHVRSIQRWRKSWRQGGEAGLPPKVPVSRPILSDELFAALERELDKGPLAHGFHKSYTPQGVAALLHRHGWSHQVPTRRALEHDDHAVGAWVEQTWPEAQEPGRRTGPGSSSRTRPGPR